jgi:hypothetical protein
MRSVVLPALIILVAALTSSARAADAHATPSPAATALPLRWNSTLSQDVNYSTFPSGARMGLNEPTQRNLPQDLQVEPIPAPSAMSSGLSVLAALAGVRLFRRLKLA